jgi:hypothetical protein
VKEKKLPLYFTKNIFVKTNIPPDIRYPALTGYPVSGFSISRISGASLIFNVYYGISHFLCGKLKRIYGKFLDELHDPRPILSLSEESFSDQLLTINTGTGKQVAWLWRVDCGTGTLQNLSAELRIESCLCRLFLKMKIYPYYPYPLYCTYL